MQAGPGGGERRLVDVHHALGVAFGEEADRPRQHRRRRLADERHPQLAGEAATGLDGPLDGTGHAGHPPLDWAAVVDSGVFTVLTGPVPHFGAQGSATSIYVRDPDGNTVELRWYPPS